MVRIAGVSGNTLTLERPLRLQYSAGLNPRIVKIVPRMNAGVENLKVERLKVGTDAERYNIYTIRLFLAANCWVRGVEAYNGFGGHVALVNSTQSEVTGCHIHHAHFYGGGGSGYGTRMEYKTGECKVENNILHDLRHSMLVQAFVNGNVHGYNYSFNANASDGWGADTSDVTLHGNYPYGNLYEGNLVQHIWLDDTHGANGPHNLFFRNRAARNGFNMTNSKSHGQSIVGNELYRGSITVQFLIGDGYRLLGSDHFAYGNNHSSKGIQPAGTGDLADYSYYLGPDPAQPPPVPAWWTIADSIPTIGVPRTLASAKTIPAYARHQAGGVKTVGPPSLYQQPTNLVVNQGQPAVFFVGAVGTPSASYRWYRNGVELPGGTNATLTIHPAREADAGTYRAIVSDPDGSVQSASATLTVNRVAETTPDGSLVRFR